MPVLYRHLYRDPKDEDAEQPVFTISRVDVMDVIRNHERIQRSRENTLKRGAQEDVSALASHLRRLTKKVRRKPIDDPPT
jgi:hypothetical protein